MPADSSAPGCGVTAALVVLDGAIGVERVFPASNGETTCLSSFDPIYIPASCVSSSLICDPCGVIATNSFGKAACLLDIHNSGETPRASVISASTVAGLFVATMLAAARWSITLDVVAGALVAPCTMDMCEAMPEVAAESEAPPVIEDWPMAAAAAF